MSKAKWMTTSIGLLGALAAAPAFAQEEAGSVHAPAVSQGEAAAGSDAASSAAATPAESETDRSIAEVVITARRREESIQKVPVAVTAISGDDLLRNNVTDVNALTTQVPNLVIIPGPSANRTVSLFSIRGLSTQDATPLSDSAVNLYVNDVVVARPQGASGSLYDIESVEILKGPQGTLFGKNSTGGSINVRSKRPGKDLEGYIGGTVGSYNERDSQLMVNTPLGDKVQLRVAAQTIKNDGWLEDVILGRKINDKDTRAARISLAAQPLEGMDTLTVYSRFYENDGGTGAIPTDLNPARYSNGFNNAMGYTGDYDPYALLAAQRSRDYRKTASGFEQSAQVGTWDLTNTTSYRIGDSLSVKNIIGTRQLDMHAYDDPDGLPLPIMAINLNVEGNQLSDEFQVLGEHGPLNWIAGLYYFHEHARSNNASYTLQRIANPPVFPQPRPFDNNSYSVTDSTGINASKAVFAQATQKLNWLVDGLSLTLGGRYTEDTRKATINNRSQASVAAGPVCGYVIDDGDPATPDVPPPIGDCPLTRQKDFSQFTYNASLDYQFTPRNLLYVATRKGYRAGAWSARPPSDTAFIVTEPEHVTDVEIGSKNDFRLGGSALRTNIALFTADYTNIQRLLSKTTTNPDNGVTTVGTVVAVGDATVRGVELDFTFLLNEWIELSGFHSYTDARFNSFDDPVSGADLSKSPFARAPKNISSLTLRYVLPVPAGIGDLSAQINYWHTAEYSGSDNYTPQAMSPGYELYNFRIDWGSIMRTNFDLGFFIKNLKNKEYGTPMNTLYGTAASPGLGSESIAPGAPRTYGLEVRYRFGALGS
ncbi:MAG: TonB-dependent receptor [Solimonas sp.]